MTPCGVVHKYRRFGTAWSLPQSPMLPFASLIQVLFLENSCFCTPLTMETANLLVMLVPILKSE